MNDLLRYSRLVSSNIKEFSLIRLEDVVQQVLLDLEIQLDETGGKVELKSLPSLEADFFQMTQLFQNLITNSLKYSKKDNKPLIRIEGATLKDSPGFCEITIIDNGIGFDEKYLDRIFKPFARLHGPGEFQGTGLGLTLCKKIVEYHESSFGKGTTFILSFPVKQNSNE